MFGEKESLELLPFLSDKLDKEILSKIDSFREDENDGFSWKELRDYGIVRETVTDTKEGITYIRRSFTSYDGSYSRSETTSLDTEWYLEFKNKLNKDEVEEELEDLYDELAMYKASGPEDFVRIIEDQIRFLIEEFEITEKDNDE